MQALRRNIHTLFYCFIAVCLCCCSRLSAQNTDSSVLSTPVVSHKDSLPKKKRISLKPAGDFDQRFSFIEKQGVSIWGYRIGASVNDVYKVGIGGYFLKQELAGVKLDQGVPINQLTKSLYYGTI